MLLNHFEEFIKRVCFVQFKSVSNHRRSVPRVWYSENVDVDENIVDCRERNAESKKVVIWNQTRLAFLAFYSRACLAWKYVSDGRRLIMHVFCPFLFGFDILLVDRAWIKFWIWDHDLLCKLLSNLSTLHVHLVILVFLLCFIVLFFFFVLWVSVEIFTHSIQEVGQKLLSIALIKTWEFRKLFINCLFQIERSHNLLDLRLLVQSTHFLSKLWTLWMQVLFVYVMYEELS